tara:strand:+ start:10364 stop:10621 length:258 start_codon:yes stop_codon:yes gene_type:complete
MNFCPLSQYKNILGVPDEGFHKYRFLGTAILDYIGGILLAIFITFVSKNKFPLVMSTISVLVGAEILHMLFGIPTNTLKFLGINC